MSPVNMKLDQGGQAQNQEDFWGFWVDTLHILPNLGAPVAPHLKLQGQHSHELQGDIYLPPFRWRGECPEQYMQNDCI